MSSYRFPALINGRELSTILGGLRLLQHNALGQGYDVPDSVLRILEDEDKPALSPEAIDSLAERLNMPEQLDGDSVPAFIGNAIRTLASAVAYEAEQFDGPPDEDLNVSGADLVDWFGEWRLEAWESIEQLRRAMARLASAPSAPDFATLDTWSPPKPVMVRAFEREAAKPEPMQAVITLKGGVTHCLPSWTLEQDTDGARIVAEPMPDSVLILDVAEVSAVHFMRAIPRAMISEAYGMFPAEQNPAMPLTLDD